MHRSVALAATLLLACTNYAKRGDHALATKNWRLAVESYSKALEDTPTADLQAKYEEARRGALEQSLAIAASCESQSDHECVLRESDYVLSLEPTHSTALKARSTARRALAFAQVSEGHRLAVLQDYGPSITALARARSLAPSDAEVDSAIARELKAMAADAAAHFDRLLSQIDSISPLERQRELLRDGARVLQEIVPVAPEHGPLLSRVRLQLQTTSAHIEEENQRLETASRAEAEALAAQEARERADRSRTVTLLGVIVGPAKADGTAWDGPGKVPPGILGDLAKALGAPEPVAAVLDFITKPSMQHLQKPDPMGTAELLIGGRSILTHSLVVTQDAYRPQWTRITWPMVDINQARIRITLIDADLMSNDPIGIVEIAPADLVRARETGSTYHVPVHHQTGRQILFVQISVM